MSLVRLFLKARHVGVMTTSQFHLSERVWKKRKTREERKAPKQFLIPEKRKVEVVDVWRGMSMGELAAALSVNLGHILEVMTFVDNSEKYRRRDQIVDDIKVLGEVVKKCGRKYRIVSNSNDETLSKEEELIRRTPDQWLDVKPRPPVVTIMGHVDHGKTTLLDKLRHSRIVESEFGGITQHIGAFSVRLKENETVTFLDTPGHAAFISMRARGANCTDIVVLVVAADDGVMEQTVQSIQMARDAQVPMIVAINKIDKPGADLDMTRRKLSQHGIMVEELGGDVQAVPVSALKGTNLNTLVDAILVQAELMELKSDYSGPVEGVVVESWTDPHRGKLTTLLIQAGTLKKGDILVAGTAVCKVRAMFNDRGEPVQSATPSSAVQTLGWRDLPSAGDVAIEADTEQLAARVVSKREQDKLKEKAEQDQVVIDEKFKEYHAKYKEQLDIRRKMGRYKRLPQKREKETQDIDHGPRLNIIVKADVDGSLEAILDVLDSYSSKKCILDVVHYGVGPVSKNDLALAETFKAIVYTFNTGLLEKSNDVTIKKHNVIYKMMDDIKNEINSLLPQRDVEEILGEANVLQLFLINEGKNKIPVAGCRCVKGSLKKSAQFRLIRSGEEIFEGTLTSLRHLKDEVATVKKDLECGIRLSDTSVKPQQGDTIVCYHIVKVPQTIDWDPGF